MAHKFTIKTIYILAVGVILLATACSHSSEGEANTPTPTTFGTELVIPPTFITISDADFEKIVEEIEKDSNPEEKTIEVLSPGSPEWNTFVIGAAKELRPHLLEFNKCFTSIDAFYDFENSDASPIEKAIELSLRYSFELSGIVQWWATIGVLDLFTEQIEALYSTGNDESPGDSISDDKVEALERFNGDIRFVLSKILGDRSLHSLLENFTNQILPSLKQGFADIGFESSDAEISKFQDMWSANPEIEMIARIYLKSVEITEARLLDLLMDNNEIFYAEFFAFYFSLSGEFYEKFDDEEIEPLARGLGEEALISLSDSQEYKRVARAFLEPIAKQSAPAECSNPDFP